jgi:hypothetical protein
MFQVGYRTLQIILVTEMPEFMFESCNARNTYVSNQSYQLRTGAQDGNQRQWDSRVCSVHLCREQRPLSVGAPAEQGSRSPPSHVETEYCVQNVYLIHRGGHLV